jgi:hypothetical protein
MGMKNWTPEAAPDRFGQLPRRRGVIFMCLHCARPTATTRDAVLKAWGERGVIAEVAAKLRCKNCRKRGMRGFLTPYWLPDSGSQTDLDKLAAQLEKLKPPKWID